MIGRTTLVTDSAIQHLTRRTPGQNSIHRGGAAMPTFKRNYILTQDGYSGADLLNDEQSARALKSIGHKCSQANRMNQDDLIRKLNSVGKQAFVERYDIFKKHASGQINRNKAIDELVKLGVSNEAGASIRVGNAKLIFEAHREADALNIILESNRLPTSVKSEARKLISGIA
jgi:hypothetical protein